MKKIYKYLIQNDGKGTINGLPSNSRVILFGRDNRGRLSYWVEANFDVKATMQFCFEVFATGEEIGCGWNYEQSFIDAPFVWHLYSKILQNCEDQYNS